MGAPLPGNPCSSALETPGRSPPWTQVKFVERTPKLSSDCVACLIWLGFIEGAPLLRSMSDMFAVS